MEAIILILERMDMIRDMMAPTMMESTMSIIGDMVDMAMEGREEIIETTVQTMLLTAIT
jgi:hypothetical protein